MPSTGRTTQARGQRAGRRRWALVGVAALAAAAVGVAVPGLLDDSDPLAPGPVREDRLAPTLASSDARPLSVALSSYGLGGLVANLGPAVLLPDGGGAWARHDLVLRNDSAETVYVDDPRFARVMGDQQLAVSDRCRFRAAGAGVEPVCTFDHSPLTLAPGESVVRGVQLWRDLPGMRPLHSGRWPTGLELRHRTSGPFQGEGDTAGATVATLSLAYTVVEPVSGVDAAVPAAFSLAGVVPPGCLPGGVPQDNARCELTGGLGVAVVEAELVGPVAAVATARPDSDLAIGYGPHVSVSFDARDGVSTPGLARASASARSEDGEGALGLTGPCGLGWLPDGRPVDPARDPCAALSAVSSIEPGDSSAFSFGLHEAVGDRRLQPGRYALTVPLGTGDPADALRLVLEARRVEVATAPPSAPPTRPAAPPAGRVGETCTGEPGEPAACREPVPLGDGLVSLVSAEVTGPGAGRVDVRLSGSSDSSDPATAGDTSGPAELAMTFVPTGDPGLDVGDFLVSSVVARSGDGRLGVRGPCGPGRDAAGLPVAPPSCPSAPRDLGFPLQSVYVSARTPEGSATPGTYDVVLPFAGGELRLVLEVATY